MNEPKATELCPLKQLILCYVNFTPINTNESNKTLKEELPPLPSTPPQVHLPPDGPEVT